MAKLLRIGPRKLMTRWLATRGPSCGKRCKTRLFWGEDMTVVLPDAPSEALYTYGLFDSDVTEMVIHAVTEGSCVIDAGAHLGYISLLAARLAGDTGRVVSIEPTPSTFAVLKDNLDGHPNMRPIQAALGEQNGTSMLQDFGVRYAAFNTLEADARLPGVGQEVAADQVEVEVLTVDHVVQAHSLRPNFIKVDTENHEDKVVAGMKETLHTYRPSVLLEMGSPQALEAATAIVRHGYTPHVRFSFGEIGPWSGTLADVNDRFKDVLFTPQSP
ncbi:MAG: FkbM family methyltransferase [Planctomycetota bacterium]